MVDQTSIEEHEFVQDYFKAPSNDARGSSLQKRIIYKLRVIHNFNSVAEFFACNETRSSHMIQNLAEGFRHEDEEEGGERTSLS